MKLGLHQTLDNYTIKERHNTNFSIMISKLNQAVDDYYDVCCEYGLFQRFYLDIIPLTISFNIEDSMRNEIR